MQKLKHQTLLIMTLLLMWTGATAKPWDNGKLQLSADNHFIEHENGTGFFFMSDTAWELLHRMTEEELDNYLQNRANKGFTVIKIVAVSEFNGAYEPTEENNTVPFLNANPSTPVETYWQWVDLVVAKAESYGLYIGLLPAWGKWIVNDPIINDSNAYSYGQWIGNRYKNNPNIIWILGGDRYGNDNTSVWNNLGSGIKSVDSNHLMTYHPGGPKSSSEWFHSASWLDFNFQQTGHNGADNSNVDAISLQDWNLSPARPTINGEPCYEDIPESFWNNPYARRFTAHDVRKDSYRSLFSGACGIAYGHNNIWQMHQPQYLSYPANSYLMTNPSGYWYDVLDTEGAYSMSNLKRLMLSRPMSRWPDDSVIFNNPGSGAARMRATRSSDYALVYYPESQTKSVQLGLLNGSSVNCWWYNVINGTASYAGAFSNSGSANFTPPNGESVLVIDNADKKFSPPGIENIWENPANKKRILILGDSITEGWGGAEKSYRYNLWNKLKNAGHDNIDFIGNQFGCYNSMPNNVNWDLNHEGHWGWRADQISTGLDTWLNDYTPDIALVLIGCNDLFAGETTSQVKTDIGTIIDKLRADNPSVTILLSQLIANGLPGGNANIEEMNVKIAEIYNEKNSAQSPIYLIDQYTGYDGIADNNADTIHPNDSGNEKIAQNYFNVLNTVLNSASTTQENITLPSSIPSVASSGNFDVQVSYNTYTTRDINVDVFDSSYNWCGYGTVTVPAGSGTRTVTVTIANEITSTTGIIRAEIRPEGGTWQEAITSSQVTVNIGGTTDSISFSSTTPVVSATGSFSVDVDYTTTVARDINVDVFDSDYNWCGYGSVTVQSGSGEKTVTVTIFNEINTSSAILKAEIRPEGGTWQDALVSDQTTVTLSLPSDAITFTSSSLSAVASGSFNVSVDYTTSVTRDINVDIFDSEYNWCGFGTVTVQPGNGTQIISVTILNPITTTTGIVKAEIRPEGGTWQDMITSATLTDIPIN